MVYIYILELQQKKYYIGKTENPSFRLEQHFESDGSFWTKKYKPISIIENIAGCDVYDEDKYTIKYMEKYGINNVRGGSFCQIKLSDNNIITLEQIIKSVTDKCYICGRNDHFAIDCKEKSVKTEKIPTINLNEKCNCPTSYIFPHRRGMCVLNKIISYFDDEDDNIDKLLKKQVWSCSYCNKEFETKKGATYHENIHCKVKKEIKLSDDTCKKNSPRCNKCGRKGHWSNKCYASKDVYGEYI
jgi:hypothetical protein|uniref:CCHC-type domain-containing protein n=1 Tax=viral metagenome TaxID=1070528 RepID=A0A6C0IUC8_9ZZZZ